MKEAATSPEVAAASPDGAMTQVSRLELPRKSSGRGLVPDNSHGPGRSVRGRTRRISLFPLTFVEGMAALRNVAAPSADLTAAAPSRRRLLGRPPLRRGMVIVVVGPGCNGVVTVSSVATLQGQLLVSAEGEACSETLAVCATLDFSVHIIRVPRLNLPVLVNVRDKGKLC